jgi:hypothetical protein
MTVTANHRRWLLPALLYLWWGVLGGRFIAAFWGAAGVAGADGSAHVAVIELYNRHVYPDTLGWIPEFFGGMPFPVYYPPLFYWLAATLMRLGGVGAVAAAKVLSVGSFAALPGVLFFLARRVGLSRVEAFAAAAAAGVVACGVNPASMGGIGLTGLFEVGLYTHVLGFDFFCLWGGALPHARRSRAATLLAILSLTATILSNVHMLPLAAAYGVSWLAVDGWRSWRLSGGRRRIVIRRTLGTAGLGTASIALAGFWLVPLLAWYSYSIAQPVPGEELARTLHLFNFVWVVCAFVMLLECRRRPALSALCAALLAGAAGSFTPLGQSLEFIPFQSWRIASSSLTLCVLPVSFALGQAMRYALGRGPRRRAVAFAACVLAFALFHQRPVPTFSVTSPEEQASIDRVVDAVRGLPPGRVLTEVVGSRVLQDASVEQVRKLVAYRALAHALARDGRPVLWAVFREHAATAPLATATADLFSTSKEDFGIGGAGIKLADSGLVGVEDSVKIARRLGVSYYLIRSPEQVARLRTAAALRHVWEIEGWHLFADGGDVTGRMEAVPGVPVLVWTPAIFKNRRPDDFDLFNLTERLMFQGHPEVCVLWANSPSVNPWDLTSALPSVITVIDPSASPQTEAWLNGLTAHAGKLSVILVDDHSRLAEQVRERRQSFAAFREVSVSDGRSRDAGGLLTDVTHQVDELLEPSLQSPARLWRTNISFFPAWRTSHQDPFWLTGQGGMATLDAQEPTLLWDCRRVRVISMAVTLIGILISGICLYSISHFG